jgi:aspartyl-tRNA(Asn)/glutamyl-tRNA(Gln) amidotransferase subunit A
MAPPIPLPLANSSLPFLQQALNSGKTTARVLVEHYLDGILDPDREGARAYLRLYEDRARHTADQVDTARKHGFSLPPFAGIPLSIKDLFDIQGEVTRAGSRVLDDHLPAAQDASSVRRLRQAGFIILGKTNMTEFAFSGLGINDHFDTPRNPYDREQGRIPGGSSSGGAVSVADDLAAAAIGTDTGGSCRIPAAFCGVVGFKPTARRVPSQGFIPLSTTLDSIGPLANHVSSCAILDDVLAGGEGQDVTPFPLDGLRLGLVTNYVAGDLDEGVAAAFERALQMLSRHGVQIMPIALSDLDDLPALNREGGIVGAEAFAWHQPLLESRAEFYDPWVKGRIEFSRAQSAADYINLLAARRAVIKRFELQTRHLDACILPTVPIIPPLLADMAEPARSRAVNGQVLRNPSIVNFLDGTAISLPCHRAGEAPVGLMLMARGGQDRKLLSIAESVESALRAALA